MDIREQIDNLFSRAIDCSFGQIVHILDGEKLSADELMKRDDVFSFFATLVNAKSHLTSHEKAIPVVVTGGDKLPTLFVEDSAITPSSILMIGIDTTLELKEITSDDNLTADWTSTIKDWLMYQSQSSGHVLDHKMISAAIIEKMIQDSSVMPDEFANLTAREFVKDCPNEQSQNIPV
jgi:hypothetical protein